MVICLERGANRLYLVRLMPLPPRHLLLHQNLSGVSLPRLSWKESVKWVSVKMSLNLDLPYTTVVCEI